MAKLRIYNDIDSQDNKFWYQWWGGDCVYFQDIDAFAASIPKDDDSIDMRIFCNGGSVVEGWQSTTDFDRAARRFPAP